MKTIEVLVELCKYPNKIFSVGDYIIRTNHWGAIVDGDGIHIELDGQIMKINNWEELKQ